MFGRLGACVVARQSLRVSSDSLLLLLLQELRWRRWKECHVVHGAHRLHLGGGDEVRGGKRPMAGHRLPLKGAVEVFKEVRF